MATLQQVLGARNLVGVIQSVKPGLPADLLPAAFLTVTRTVDGAYCTYRKVVGERRVARMAMYGSPSKVRELKGISEVPVKLIHTIESIFFQPSVLTNLTNLAEAKQRLGQQEVARETKSFKDLFVNLRVAAVFSLLANGQIYFDGNGELLPTATGAVYTVDMQIPSGNKNQLNVLGKGNILTASWATTSTSILTQIKALKRAARKLTGYPLKNAFYGANVLPYIVNNTELSSYMKRNIAFQEALKNDELPAGFLGLDWHPVDEAFFSTNATNTGATLDGGTPTELFGADQVTFTPDVNPEWYELVEGTYPVPTSVDEGQTADELIAEVMTVAGMFAYAYITKDPVTVKEVAGDTVLPLIKVPSAVFLATVKF